MPETQSPAGPRWIRRLGARLKSSVPFVSGVAAALIALLVYNILFPPAHQLTQAEVKQAVDQTLASATPPPAFSAQVYQAIRPSLVLIQTRGATEDGLGSGVIVDDRGDVLTSLHVVAQANEILVMFADGSQSAAQVTSTLPSSDIAVISPEKPPAKIVPAVLGNPGAMHVGDDAYVVGNPFGLYSSMSAGVISGFNRSFEPPNGGQTLQGLIQVDAAINPGNSGGPLLNRDGEVIGIVTGIVNPTDQNVFIGIGFAVPINVAGGAMGAPQY